MYNREIFHSFSPFIAACIPTFEYNSFYKSFLRSLFAFEGLKDIATMYSASSSGEKNRF